MENGVRREFQKGVFLSLEGDKSRWWEDNYSGISMILKEISQGILIQWHTLQINEYFLFTKNKNVCTFSNYEKLAFVT